MLKKYQLRSYNFRLVFLLVATTIYGIIVINSAEPAYTIRQSFGLVLAIAAMLVVSLIDYNWILKYYWLMYFGNILILLLVQFMGDDGKGAQRWVSIFGIRLQPSELTKIILILFTVKLISLYKDKLNTWKFLTALAVLLMIPLGLVVTQPDLSTTLLMFFILITVIFCAGLSYRIIGLAIVICVPLITGTLIYISNPENEVPFLQKYQRERIMDFLYPDENDAGVYQQKNAVQAIGSGQLTGKGLNNDDPSSLKNANYIPEAHTDFIFAVIGEELGFMGTFLAIFLLSCIVLECIIMAVKAKDFTGRLICCGVAAYVAYQTFINIGVVTRILPNTGLPLPFFSYGMSSLVALFISMGIVLNVSLQRNIERDDEIFASDFKG